jgi:hypothetical protein
MAFILQKWNTTTETWDDLSEEAKKFNLDMHLDIFGVREIEYSGQTLILDDENTIEDGDYIRYGTDGSANNYQSIIQGISKEMNWPTNHYWVAGLNSPTFDVDTTVSGKMYWALQSGQAEEIEFSIPNNMTAGVTYRVKVKLRLNSGGGSDVIRFGCGWGSASANFIEFTPTGTEAEYEGTFVADERTFVIYSSTANNGSAFEIDDLELFVESDPILFSGIVTELKHLLKKGKYEFDLPSEINDLKTNDIPRTLTGDNLLQRLYDALPDDYVIVVMDSTAQTLLEIYQSGFDTITYPGDEVTGTDSNIYTCKVSHRASTANKPITGGSWSTYWELAGSTGGTWEASKQYNTMKFNDLLYDILLIANADTFGNNILYCVVVNKELRMYGVNINGGPTLISNQYVEECEEDLAEEIVEVEYFDNINDDLRGTGSMNWSNNAYEEFKVKLHKLKATYEKALMNLTGCSRPGGGTAITGFVTGIEKKGSMFTYELTYLERVT